MPVMFSNGREGVTVVDDADRKGDLSYGEFVRKAAVRGVTAVVGDYDGDGKSDIALVGVMVGRKVHWPIPVAFSLGRMGFKVSTGIEIAAAADANGKAVTIKDALVQQWSQGSRKLMGDFDGDGKSDIALLPVISPEEGSVGATQIPIIFSDGSGTQWKVTTGEVGDFSTWCHNTKAAVGDFDGDGKSDIVCTGGSKWETVTDSIPVAYSNGRQGGWQVETGEAVTFNSMAGAGKDNAQFLLGDFDGDGKTDVVAFSPGNAALSIPVAFSNSRGDWTVVQGGHALAADKTAAEVGDFDGDGRDDLLLLGPDTKGFVTVLYSKGRTGWAVKNLSVGRWANRATSEGVHRFVGDFDGDGRADICLSDSFAGQDLMFLFGMPDQEGFTPISQYSGQFSEKVQKLSRVTKGSLDGPLSEQIRTVMV